MFLFLSFLLAAAHCVPLSHSPSEPYVEVIKCGPASQDMGGFVWPTRRKKILRTDLTNMVMRSLGREQAADLEGRMHESAQAGKNRPLWVVRGSCQGRASSRLDGKQRKSTSSFLSTEICFPAAENVCMHIYRRVVCSIARETPVLSWVQNQRLASAGLRVQMKGSDTLAGDVIYNSGPALQAQRHRKRVLFISIKGVAPSKVYRKKTIFRMPCGFFCKQMKTKDSCL